MATGIIGTGAIFGSSMGSTRCSAIFFSTTNIARSTATNGKTTALIRLAAKLITDTKDRATLLSTDRKARLRKTAILPVSTRRAVVSAIPNTPRKAGAIEVRNTLRPRRAIPMRIIVPKRSATRRRPRNRRRGRIVPHQRRRTHPPEARAEVSEGTTESCGVFTRGNRTAARARSSPRSLVPHQRRRAHPPEARGRTFEDTAEACVWYFRMATERPSGTGLPASVTLIHSSRINVVARTLQKPGPNLRKTPLGARGYLLVVTEWPSGAGFPAKVILFTRPARTPSHSPSRSPGRTFGRQR